MNLLAYYHAPGGLLLVLLILLLLFIPAWPYSRSWGPGPASGVGFVLLVLVVLLLVGCVTNPLTGKKELEPNVRNQLLSVAQAEIHGLANDYLQTGKVDYKKDLISGALSQVYTLEGTATPATQASVGAAVATVITDPSLKAAVTSAALNTINAVPAGTAKPTAINGAVTALDLALSQLKAPTSSIWNKHQSLSFAREDMRRGLDKGDQRRPKLDKGDQRRGPLSVILKFLGLGK